MVMMCVFLQHKSTFCCHIPTNVPWIVDHHHNSNCITAIVSQCNTVSKYFSFTVILFVQNNIYSFSRGTLSTVVSNIILCYHNDSISVLRVLQSKMITVSQFIPMQCQYYRNSSCSKSNIHRRWSSVIPILYYHNNSIPVLHVLQSKIITASQYYRNSSILHRRWSYSVIL